ncbi:CoA transferase [Saccharomonospora sp. NPDC006951]
MSQPAAPLAGVKVVDFTIMIAGPYGGRLLADAGADVVKVEPPEGDPMRSRAPLRDGASSYFGSLNAGKKSVALDLKQPAQREQALALVAEADVVIENFRPGVMAKLGLGYDTCGEVNPALIYCSISGYGQRGPKAGYPAYAPILHAVSGFDLANAGYQRGEAEPAATGIFVADVMAGQVSYAAILTALLGRARSGKGDHVDVSLYDIMLSTLVYETQAVQEPERSPGKTVYRPCAVGDEYLLIAAITDRNFRALVAVMDRPDLLADSRFATMTERELHWEQWLDEVAAWAADKNVDTLERTLLDNGIPCARYRDVAEALADPQVRFRGSLRTAADDGGTFSYLGPPWSHTTWRADGSATPVARLGADNTEILGRWRSSAVGSTERTVR